jgi:hypothetical protein
VGAFHRAETVASGAGKSFYRTEKSFFRTGFLWKQAKTAKKRQF